MHRLKHNRFSNDLSDGVATFQKLRDRVAATAPSSAAFILSEESIRYGLDHTFLPRYGPTQVASSCVLANDPLREYGLGKAPSPVVATSDTMGFSFWISVPLPACIHSIGGFTFEISGFSV